MKIHIANKKLKRALEEDSECKKRFGAEMAKKIRLRMTVLAAAESLADFWPPASGPERCHELQGGLAGTFSVDVRQPYRLLFRPRSQDSTNTPPEKGKEWWLTIQEIEILGIEDTHG
jgi:proteic killer suppression protein